MKSTSVINDTTGMDIVEILTMAFLTVGIISFLIGIVFQKWKMDKQMKERQEEQEKETSFWKRRYTKLWRKLVKDGEDWKYR